MKAKMIIYMEGGVIQDIVANQPIEIIVLDEDRFDEGDLDSICYFDECQYCSPESMARSPRNFRRIREDAKKDWNKRMDELKNYLND